MRADSSVFDNFQDSIDSTFDSIELIRRIDSCLASDALDCLGLQGVAIGLSRRTTSATISGPAATIELTRAPASGRQPVHLGGATIDRAARGAVIVVAAGGDPSAAAWGGLLTAAARERGIAGIVVDGAARDIDEIEAAGMPLFARATIPVSARGRWIEAAAGGTVDIAGVQVEPGDWVVADGSGVVFIPRRNLLDVARVATRLSAAERTMASRLAGGEPAATVLDRSYETLLASAP